MQLQRESEIKDKVNFFSFWDITDHRTIKGSRYSYEVLGNWEDGHITWETIIVMRRDEPICLEKYAREN